MCNSRRLFAGMIRQFPVAGTIVCKPEPGMAGNAMSIFDTAADAYDDWYDSPEGSAIFQEEKDCLQLLCSSFSGRWLEVGAGTGRFAKALGCEYGIDLSQQRQALSGCFLTPVLPSVKGCPRPGRRMSSDRREIRKSRPLWPNLLRRLRYREVRRPGSAGLPPCF